MNSNYNYKRPPLSLLCDYDNDYVSGDEVESNKQMILAALNEMGLSACVDIVGVNATYSEYVVSLLNEAGNKIKLSDSPISYHTLVKDCSLFNAGNIIAEYDYSCGQITVSVPNIKPSVLGLKGLLKDAPRGDFNHKLLGFKVGRDSSGKDVFCSLAYNSQNYIITGENDEERNCCLKVIITNLLYSFSPKGMSFIFISFGGATLKSFAHIPHLLIDEIITEPDRIMKVLSWAADEMKRRMHLFEMGIDGKTPCNEVVYNRLVDDDKKLPEIVIVLDGYIDPEFPYVKELEKRLDGLVNRPYGWGMEHEVLCPHIGLHLIFSVKNWSAHPLHFIGTRLVFKTGSEKWSRLWLKGHHGAEKLTGHNDMYVYSPGYVGNITRVQGCYISEEEVKSVTDFIIKNNESAFDDEVKDYIDTHDIGDCSGVTAISFSGTMAEWRRAGLGNSAPDKGRFIIHCSDGDIVC